ncbi:DUF2129 domain-containing protein [Fructobacillus tropaeoli]|nr:DUF2129 domain-containing protein [Fructobacillus tropaeoli]
MFTMKERRAVYVFLRGLKHVEQLKKFGDISYISKRMGYAELYLNEDDVEKTVDKLNQYRFVKTVKVSPRPDIDPDLDDVHDDVFFEAYDQAQEDVEKDRSDEKSADLKGQSRVKLAQQTGQGKGQSEAKLAEPTDQGQNQPPKKNNRQDDGQQDLQTDGKAHVPAEKGGKS